MHVKGFSEAEVISGHDSQFHFSRIFNMNVIFAQHYLILCCDIFVVLASFLSNDGTKLRKFEKCNCSVRDHTVLSFWVNKFPRFLPCEL